MIYKIILLLFIFSLTLFSQHIKVASYNVENLFDLNYDKTEYKEYIPYKKSNWNKKTYTKKLKNISRVILELDADILALQEIESQKALDDLLTYLPKYKYYSFVKNKNSAIGLAVISKYKVEKTKQIKIKSHNKYARPIQEVTIKIGGKELIIYNNHWPSKRAAENQRIEYALSLQNYLKNSNTSKDYIITGDFNSNYDEFHTFLHDKKLNNSYGITGINQVLNTTIDKKFVTKNSITTYNKIVHYNLWLEKSYQNRFSYKYRGSNNTPDNILINKSLLDNKEISYKNNSFEVFKPKYLFQNNKIQRWKVKKKKHLGMGYSDHLPIYATFSTSESFKKDVVKRITTNISDLYNVEDIEKKLTLKNVIVIYKDKSNVIIKQKNNRAIFIYKQAKELKLGNIYDIEVKEIKTYNGLKEIVKIDKIYFKETSNSYKNYYLDANNINILDYEYQNEIITNLNAFYTDGYLYYKFKNKKQKIKVYSKDKSLLPINGQKVIIISAHLGYFKSKPQIVIYKESDFIVN